MTFFHRGGAWDATDATSYNVTIPTLAGGGVMWVAAASQGSGSVASPPTLTMTGATFTLVRTEAVGADRVSVWYSQDYDAGTSVTLNFATVSILGLHWCVEEQIPGLTAGDPVVQTNYVTATATTLSTTLAAGTGELFGVLILASFLGAVVPNPGTNLYGAGGSSPTNGFATYWSAAMSTTPSVDSLAGGTHGLIVVEAAPFAVEPEVPEVVEPPEPIDTEGCETLEYANADGETIRFVTLVEVTGRMMPPILVSSLGVPAGHGSRFRGASHLERPVVTPVVAPGIFEDRAELRRWARVLDPAKGEGTLTVVGGEWAGRRLRCVYEAGLDQLAESSRSPLPATLIWRAAYPYWEDAAESSETVTQDATTHLWFPFLPLVLGASDTFDSFEMTNEGDVVSWPVVTVTGPVIDPELRNDTTGQLWHLTGTVPAGDVLTVDTRPGFKTVDVDGVNRFGWLTPESSLWGLAPGVNEVVVSGASTTTATSVRFAWRQAWLAA